MAHFVRWTSAHDSGPKPRISKTIQSAAPGQSYKFGVYGMVAGLRVGPNNPAYGLAREASTSGILGNDLAWFEMFPGQVGNVMIEIRDSQNQIWDSFQLAIKGGASAQSAVLGGSVGKRNRKENVKNFALDQATVISTLQRIPKSDGGKKEEWQVTPLSGANGNCPDLLANAIWDFQLHWKNQGQFRNIDGVCDPGGRTFQLMSALADKRPLPAPPARSRSVPAPRVYGTWQISNMTSVTAGEVGLLGLVDIEFTDPTEKKFVAHTYGAGAGLSFQPDKFAKFLEGKGIDGNAKATFLGLLKLIGVGQLTSIGDLLSKMGLALPSYSAGILFPNPILAKLGRPPVISRYALVGGSRPPIGVLNGGAGLGVGAEMNLVCLGGPLGGAAGLLADFWGFFATAGVGLKAGAGFSAMIYSVQGVVDS